MRHDTHALSVLYDTLLFAVMVSLSATMLLPAVTTSISRNISLEKHRELTVDDVLRTLLTSRPESFSYTFAGPTLDTVAKGLGVNTTSPGLYDTIRHWILDNEPRHETYAGLIADDLTGQLRIPTPNGTIRLNLLTADFDTQLITSLQDFFTPLFRGRYHYNLTATWHPLKGLRLGGELSLGPPRPTQTSHVATTQIAIPLTPALRIGNTTLLLTHHALARYLTDINLTGNNTIPQVINIRTVLNDYLHHTPPNDTRPSAKDSVQENLTKLLDGILITGIHDTNDTTIFPGVLNATLDALLTPLTNATRHTNTSTNYSLGDLTDTLDHLLTSVNSTTNLPLTQAFLDHLNNTLSTLFNTTFPTPAHAIQTLKNWTLNQTTSLLNTLLAPLLDTTTDLLLDATDGLAILHDTLQRLILDRLTLPYATITLTIWPVHP
jgi:hypothetical protein